ncbi:type II toxin-antitoxin system RelE/ParE family toxin [Pseudomaricurvus alkylphenolicus]|jgi:plasmid stabilization system protein ParE|uniref:type II toxin-antitoxin system RelE/ParE family toxin n=1 Tax=Pseudomaricurvus alkylphenolicus TaxID=1306991 RepID=UPI001422883E|nr:type II toxin-antitoxin system RelE/ParE family toxin [Pseudomaricurvus alkylphenolicus]NIB42763.1 type II toxin-antitoxin system RelE/ParE family toxin [Pseudomaricurvus alkylphenolicus]
MRLKYTPQAIEDLKRLYDFVAPKSPLAARRVAIDIQEAAEKLKVFPKIGLPVSRSTDTYLLKDLYIGDYSIRYQISSPEQIEILRIWHNKDIEKDL